MWNIFGHTDKAITVKNNKNNFNAVHIVITL